LKDVATGELRKPRKNQFRAVANVSASQQPMWKSLISFSLDELMLLGVAK